MAKNLSPNIIVFSHDADAGKYVKTRLAAGGTTLSILLLDGSIKSLRRATRHIRAKSSIVVFTSSRKCTKRHLEFAAETIKRKGTVLVWCDAELHSNLATLPDLLFFQLGAIVERDLGLIVEAARVAHFVGAPVGNVTVARSAGELGRRLRLAYGRSPLSESFTKSDGARDLKIFAKNDSLAASIGAKKTRLDLVDPIVSVAAIGKLAAHSPRPSDVDQDQIDHQLADLIAIPPRRILSETASKRLLGAFGLSCPREHLCDSATKAVRVAESMGGPLVLKLVRPSLESKAAQGAVEVDIDTTPKLKNAYQSLMALDKRISPRPGLGILVSPQIEASARLWVRLEDISPFGRLLLIGIGDKMEPNPVLAFTTPAQPIQVAACLSGSQMNLSDHEIIALTDAIVRLSLACHVLSARIDRLEVHPLVAPKTGPALMLDALIEIAD